MKIYIVRHGETEANKNGLLQGWSDTPLSDLGVKLAEYTGEGLKDIKFDAVFSSPLKRAYDTAQIIMNKNNFNNINIQTDNRLKELSMGDWEGKCIKGEKAELPLNKIKLFFENPFLLEAFPNGEDARMVCKRTQDFLNDLVTNHNYENVLIATHGFATRAILNFMYEDKENFWQGNVPLNCSVNIIEYKNGDFNFLEKDKIYYSKDIVIDRYKIK